ncbi:aminotransferase class I/II-fold pyridoxal phosphate-dependent enzyme [Fluviispira multicolorata]|uniref:Aminotransferase class I/II-fold pyridoxal phosphate-dependent enzyme n=1 Tax=Fluviispira multicolorata TaxID=2654512 RepID=A0A833N4V8_9BACT|nr:aminotransferase class I/II-fold pyridoxal phosphate-dependent enzyme [Fluviispira multicolorata]KAB8029093.1 aminotransferase class I/II-fold pyridoxal phosphate-dependent enzyme [Fluviispira multicolorata]
MKYVSEEQKKNWTFDIEDFLSNCKKSSSDAYENLKNILQFLDDPLTREKARVSLTDLNKYFLKLDSSHDAINTFHFSIDKLITDGEENSPHSLLLLQLPSIFTPEDWSFTFYEGLARYPISEFHHRTLAELGCGNGWISIALAKKCFPQHIYGLDINPRAIVCAKINLYLNGLDDKGKPYIDSEGKTLFDRVQFHVSDLLEFCLLNKIQLDKVIGCIPQVLAPDTHLLPNIIHDNVEDESLFSLSNYCSKQGYIEDQFGLGLIARAVEESLETMKPAGKIILNLGGRPGKAVLDRLLTRRGFKTSVVWKTKIEQAGDTEILPLVEIEQTTSHRFEFYMGANSEESISARTAYVYSQNGGKVFHSLQVVEADMRDNIKMKKILRLLKKEDYVAARSGFDLTYTDRSLVEEKMSFLAKLSEKLNNQDSIEYQDVRGETGFRRHIAEYFRTYWRVPITAKSILVAPSRLSFVKNIISMYNVNKVLVDNEFYKDLPQEWLHTPDSHNLKQKDIFVLESPKQSELLCKLVATFEPQVVICSISEAELRSQDSFRRLIETTQKYGVRLFVDFSNGMELSSTPQVNGIFEYISEQSLPLHVSLFCGLIRNRLYSDLEIAFLISENDTTLTSLCNVAEITYSRASLIIQEYYNTILFDLLNFHVRNIKRERTYTPRLPTAEGLLFLEKFTSFSSNCTKSFHHPSIFYSHPALDRNSVRLDYGENLFASPNFLKAAIFEGFVRQNISQSETQIEDEILNYISNKFNIKGVRSENIVVANGIAPLFSGISEYCALNNQIILFPSGSYGYFVASSQFYGVEIINFKTSIENNFKIKAEELKETLSQQTKKVWIFLNAPVVNPSGAIYSKEEIYELFKVAAEYDSVIIMDTVFSGLEFQADYNKYNITDITKVINQENMSFILLGGVSKELAAGGLRVGYGYGNKLFLQNALRKGLTNSLPVNIKYAIKKIFQTMNNQSGKVKKHFVNQREFLEKRASRLSEVLTQNGWKPLPSQGGLFLIAKPEKIIGRNITIKKDNIEIKTVISGKNIHEILFYKTGLLINGSEWIDVPEFCRFVLSVSDYEFDSAIEKLKSFWNLIAMEE